MPLDLLEVEVADDCGLPAARRNSLGRERWLASRITDYRFTLRRRCECTPEWAGPTEITVRSGIVVSATVNGGPAPEGATFTIDTLLDQIAAALNEPVTTLVTYDQTLGYPLDVQLDLDAIAVDGGLSLTITDFRRLH